MGAYLITALVPGRHVPAAEAVDRAKAMLVPHAARFNTVTDATVPPRPPYRRPKYRKQWPAPTFALVTPDGAWHENPNKPYEGNAAWLALWPGLAKVRNATPVVLRVHY